MSWAGANHPFRAQASRENKASGVATSISEDIRALCDTPQGHQALSGQDGLSAHVSQLVPWPCGRRRVPGRSCCPVTSQPAGGRSATLYPFPPARDHHLSSLDLTLTLHVDLPSCLPCFFCQCHQPSVSTHQCHSPTGSFYSRHMWPKVGAYKPPGLILSGASNHWPYRAVGEPPACWFQLQL